MMFNIEIKDRFLKNKEIKNKSLKANEYINEGNIDDKSEVKIIFEECITFDVYLTNYGKPYTGSKVITLSS